MKERDKKDRGGPPTGSRSGPRARKYPRGLSSRKQLVQAGRTA